MKLHSEHSEVERSGVISESVFTIKTTSNSFMILSEGIYTDKILAVVRELSCNAYDAHVAAGKPNVPFEIHLPNSLEPWFHVKDFGTGLSDDQVRGKLITTIIDGVVHERREDGIYTTYFESTKSDSNKFIGALGLGSKSPFSYTKAFEVISSYKGVRRIYSAFINERGEPSIALLGEIATTDCDGLEVKITVKRDDFQHFADRTAKSLRWFPVKPKVIGYRNFQFAEVPEHRSEGANWKIFGSNFTGDYSKMTAVQGNVAYKVDVSKLGFTKADEVILNNGHIVGFFEIGELAVAASREEIRYDDQSIAALLKRVHAIRAEVMKQFVAKVEELKDKNDWNLFIELEKMGAKVFGYAPHLIEFLSSATDPRLKKYKSLGGKFKLDAPRGHTLVGYKLGRDSTPDKAVLHRSRMSPGATDADEDYEFFFNDVKMGGISRVDHYLRTVNRYKQAIVIRTVDTIYKEGSKPGDDLKMNPADLWTDAHYKKELSIIKASLGDIEIRLTSTLPAPPREKREIDLPVYQFSKVHSSRYGHSSVVWDKIIEPDMEEGGLYFDMRNGAVITWPDAKGEMHDLSWSAEDIQKNLSLAVTLINKAHGTSYKVDDVYGLGVAAKKKAVKNPEWTNIFSLLKPLIANYQPQATFHAKMAKTGEAMGIKQLVTRNNPICRKFIKGFATLVATSPFKLGLNEFIDDSENFRDQHQYNAYEMLKSLDIAFQSKILDNTCKSGYFTDKKLFEKEYPMLTFVDQFEYLNSDQIELFFDYIRTVDKASNRS